MAESNNAATPAIHTNIESGHFDEKAAHHDNTHAPMKPKAEDEEEDADMDALIEDLESEDGDLEDEDEEEGAGPSQGRTIPEEMLQTDTRLGLTDCKSSLPSSAD
jgi:H+-transporting ATPase